MTNLSAAHVPEVLDAAVPDRLPWVTPALVVLPPLEQLTLATGFINGTCDPNTGCTFSLLSTMPGGHAG